MGDVEKMMDTMPVTASQARSIAQEVMSTEFQPILFELEQTREELRQLNEGDRVVLPKSREHAKMMLIIAMNYLGIKPGQTFSYGDTDGY
jgi:hypothetical protein